MSPTVPWPQCVAKVSPISDGAAALRLRSCIWQLLQFWLNRALPRLACSSVYEPSCGISETTISWPYIHGCSLEMYVYIPGLSNVTEPSSDGVILWVVHEPSWAMMVWSKFPLFTHVTLEPTLTRARYGLNSN